MSTSTLNVWITNLGDPCTIVNTHPWVVAVSHCDGHVLNWSGGRYRHHRDDAWTPIPHHTPSGEVGGWWFDSVPTKDGHVEIELPPGCYVVRATQHSWFVNEKLRGNWATERAIVQASCGQEICTTLYAPSVKSCSVPLFEMVIPLLVKHRIIKRDQAQAAIEAMEAIFGPEAASSYEQEEFETLRRAFKQMGEETSEKREEKGEG